MTWETFGSLKGAKGDTGPSGPVGPGIRRLASRVSFETFAVVAYDGDSGGYPIRPPVAAGLVWWVGPLAPTAALDGDIWVNTA